MSDYTGTCTAPDDALDSPTAASGSFHTDTPLPHTGDIRRVIRSVWNLWSNQVVGTIQYLLSRVADS